MFCWNDGIININIDNYYYNKYYYTSNTNETEGETGCDIQA